MRSDGNGEEQYPASSRSVKSLREVRLLALLRDVVAEHGKVKGAEVLGVSFRTLSRAEGTGRLTPRLADALESHLVQGGGTAAAQQRRRLGELADRVALLEAALVDGLEELRKEQARLWEHAERRVAALEAGANATAATTGASAAGSGNSSTGGVSKAQPAGQGVSAKPVVQSPRRVYPDLVTAEAEPGEELVYGDAATAVIVKWREARDAFGAATDAMDILNARQRRLELEIELIEKHELTLPPATRPWDWGDRRQEVRRRTELLDELIVDRKMLRLRRFLTLGLWRK